MTSAMVWGAGGGIGRQDIERLGLVVLFGSGETSASGRKVYDWLFRRLPVEPRVAVLETPAGFQPNSALVAEKVADFLRTRLQNFRPRVAVVPARQRGTAFSPEDPTILAPLLQTDAIFLGPGSPTYAVRQLENSLAWHYLLARHRLGAAVVLASAATIAAGAHALPVYEIYKAGEDLHWRTGLDFFGAYGLSLVPVPHWDNREGGAELDTSRCYMGRARFERLMAMLPPGQTVVGIEEHTALVVDVASSGCHVLGRGAVVVLRHGEESRFEGGQDFPLGLLGTHRLPTPDDRLPAGVWRAVVAAKESESTTAAAPPLRVADLVERREAARARHDWAAADLLRDQVADLGWRIQDTLEGPRLSPVSERDG